LARLWSSGGIRAVIALVLVTVAYWRKISMEEHAQSGAFGVEDEEYRQHLEPDSRRVLKRVQKCVSVPAMLVIREVLGRLRHCGSSQRHFSPGRKPREWR
jgi:hypothetical protein